MSEKTFCRGCLFGKNRVVLYNECDLIHYHSMTNKDGLKYGINDYHFKPLEIAVVKELLQRREEIVTTAHKTYRNAKRKYESMLNEYRKIILPLDGSPEMEPKIS